MYRYKHASIHGTFYIYIYIHSEYFTTDYIVNFVLFEYPPNTITQKKNGECTLK